MTEFDNNNSNNSVLTSSNKFVYNQSELITPANNYSFFGTAKQFIHFSIVKQAVDGKVLYVYATDSNNKNYKLTGYLHAFHIYGYIHKDISAFKGIRMQLSYVSDRIDPACYIPLNSHTSDDYFDVIFYRTIDTTDKHVGFCFTPYDIDNKPDAGIPWYASVNIDVYKIA